MKEGAVSLNARQHQNFNKTLQDCSKKLSVTLVADAIFNTIVQQLPRFLARCFRYQRHQLNEIVLPQSPVRRSISKLAYSDTWDLS
jgi:hypothetical protein